MEEDDMESDALERYRTGHMLDDELLDVDMA
jgi:hypothetical protein